MSCYNNRSAWRFATLLPLAFLVLASPFITSTLQAQPDVPPWSTAPELWVRIQDSTYIWRIGGNGDTVPPSWFAASYTFMMSYDSTCETRYLFSECKLNNNLWKLAKWWNNRKVNANADLLSYNSRTIPATLHSGDTISFFRYVYWRDPVISLQDTNNYFAIDSLDFAVELVRTSDSSRVALIDTIGFLPNYVRGRPNIHGMHPLMETVNYRVPAVLDGTTAFLRVRVYHRGDGKYWFTRTDSYTVGVSQWLFDTTMTRYTNLFQPGNAKYSLPELHAAERAPSEHSLLDVMLTTGTEAIISFESSTDGKGTTVAVYNELGSNIFMPYLAASGSGRQQVSYNFAQSGVHFIGLLYNGTLVAVRKLLISK